MLQGLVFAGRVVEDFKLSTGTFVHVGPLRVAAIAAASPVMQDALVAGQDQTCVALLAWPNLHACRRLMGRWTRRSKKLCRCRRATRRGRAACAQRRPRGQQPADPPRMLLSEPPSIDGNELTDKGYINQRAALQRRADRCSGCMPIVQGRTSLSCN